MFDSDPKLVTSLMEGVEAAAGFENMAPEISGRDYRLNLRGGLTVRD